jgi:hypothetical protein
MYTINGNYYFDFTPHIDMKGLEDIYSDIVLGIVKTDIEGAIKDSGADTGNFLDKSVPSIINTTQKAIKDPTNPYYKYYEELGFDQAACRTFNKYVMELSTMGQLLILRGHGNKSIYHKHKEDSCFDYPAYTHFPKLKNWIDNLKVFDSIGRIIFWFNAPGEYGSIHRDTFLGYPDHFILFNMRPERKDLFVIHPETKEQLVIPSKAYVFDTRNYHGTMGKDFSGFTFRIDGVYNKEWAQSVGIWDHFNPDNYK